MRRLRVDLVLGLLPLAAASGGCATGSTCDGAACSAAAPDPGAGAAGASSGTEAAGSAGAIATTGGVSGAAIDAGVGTSLDAGMVAAIDAAPELQTPVVRGDRCVLALGDVAMEIDATLGGRITSLRLGQVELLSGPSVNASNYGSTFWTSPQADWGWPPVAAIDNAPFSVAPSTDSECVLQGAVVADSAHPNVDGVQISKHFSADVAAQALVAQYTIANQGTGALQLAPWEIARVAPGGLTFYASDSDPGGDKQPPTVRAAGCVWLEHDPSIAVDSKLFGDGKGWVAHVSPDNVLLLRVFEDVAPGAAASGEAEIEMYTGAGYDEIECQGGSMPIEPGAERVWSVRWIVRALPASIARSAGNPDLVAFVQSLL